MARTCPITGLPVVGVPAAYRSIVPTLPDTSLIYVFGPCDVVLNLHAPEPSQLRCAVMVSIDAVYICNGPERVVECIPAKVIAGFATSPTCLFDDSESDSATVAIYTDRSQYSHDLLMIITNADLSSISRALAAITQTSPQPLVCGFPDGPPPPPDAIQALQLNLRDAPQDPADVYVVPMRVLETDPAPPASASASVSRPPISGVPASHHADASSPAPSPAGVLAIRPTSVEETRKVAVAASALHEAADRVASLVLALQPLRARLAPSDGDDPIHAVTTAVREAAASRGTVDQLPPDVAACIDELTADVVVAPRPPRPEASLEADYRLNPPLKYVGDDVPPAFAELREFVAYYCKRVTKMNHRHVPQARVLVVTYDELVVFDEGDTDTEHPRRCHPINRLTGLMVRGKDVAFLTAAEDYDLWVVVDEKPDKLVSVVQAVYRHHCMRKLPKRDASDERLMSIPLFDWAEEKLRLRSGPDVANYVPNWVKREAAMRALLSHWESAVRQRDRINADAKKLLQNRLREMYGRLLESGRVGRAPPGVLEHLGLARRSREDVLHSLTRQTQFADALVGQLRQLAEKTSEAAAAAAAAAPAQYALTAAMPSAAKEDGTNPQPPAGTLQVAATIAPSNANVKVVVRGTRPSAAAPPGVRVPVSAWSMERSGAKACAPCDSSPVTLVNGSLTVNLPNWRRPRVLFDAGGPVLQCQLLGLALITAHPNGALHAWDTRDGQRLRSMVEHTAAVTQFRAAAYQLVSASVDGGVCVWCAESGALLATLHAHAGAATCIDFEPYGRTLLTGGSDGGIHVFDMVDVAHIRPLVAHQQPVLAVRLVGHAGNAVSLDAHWLIHWDLPAGAVLRSISLGGSIGVSLTVVSSVAVIGTQTGELLCWDAAVATPVAEALAPSRGCHSGSVTTLAGLPSQRSVGLVVSGSSDGTVRMWCVHPRSAGTQILLFSATDDHVPVSCVDVSTSGPSPRIVVASGRHVLLWHVASDDADESDGEENDSEAEREDY